MATKQNPGKYDCYAKAEPDEPMFILLGRDKHAPTLIWLWAVLREFDDEDPAKVGEARQCVADMMEWAHQHKRPVVGLGQATLAGLMELIRAVNSAAKAYREKPPTNIATTFELIQLFLAETSFETVADQAAAAADAADAEG